MKKQIFAIVAVLAVFTIGTSMMYQSYASSSLPCYVGQPCSSRLDTVKVIFHFKANCVGMPNMKTLIFDQEQVAPIASGISNRVGNLTLYVTAGLDAPLPLMFFAKSENGKYAILGNFFDPHVGGVTVHIFVNWGTPC